MEKQYKAIIKRTIDYKIGFTPPSPEQAKKDIKILLKNIDWNDEYIAKEDSEIISVS